MPRTQLAIANIGNSGAVAEDLAGNVPDLANGNSFAPGDDVFLLCWAVSSAGTITVDTPPDAFGRVASSAQEQHTFTSTERFWRGPFPAHLFAQSDGLVHVDVTTASFRYQPIRLTKPQALV